MACFVCLPAAFLAFSCKGNGSRGMNCTWESLIGDILRIRLNFVRFGRVGGYLKVLMHPTRDDDNRLRKQTPTVALDELYEGLGYAWV